ncbi:MAG: FAD-dependent monooxygenase [Pseudomonadota bacterium]
MHKVEIIGAGPAGLYTAILLKRAMPDVAVRVQEQNPRGATFGFGVVFSDRALDFLERDDPETHASLTPHMERWQNMTLALPGGTVSLDGVGFTAIGRLDLIELLRQEAERLSVDLRFDTEIRDLDRLDADLIIGADGLNSRVRQRYEDAFAPQVSQFTNHFAWFGADVAFDTLTQTFVDTEFGPMNAHHYRYAPGRSTFIVECEDAVFQKAGFAGESEARSAERCAGYFRDALRGAPLITNKSNWRQFPKLWCRFWIAGRAVLLGDAAHTAHFSVGSGTRLAMEDALALVGALKAAPDLTTALAQYQATRPPIAHKIVEAANTSAAWYEGFGAKMTLEPMAFAYDYLTRSGRMSDEKLRQIAPGFMADYMAWRGVA